MAKLSPSSPVIEANSSKTTFLSNITSFLMSKKGMYLISAVVLICIGIYYIKTRSSKTEQVQSQELPPAPPGYVTVPIEVVQKLQQNETNYRNINNSNLQQQAIDESNFDESNFQAENVPELRHNTLDEEEDEEEEPIAQQNLTQEEMESIQAQLNAMQQQRSNA